MSGPLSKKLKEDKERINGDELKEFQKTHTVKEICEHFGISARHHLYSLYSFFGIIPINYKIGRYEEAKNNIDENEFKKYVICHTRDEICSYFKISSTIMY